MRFLLGGVPLGPDGGVDGLPAGPSLVVVDDAHRREDLAVLLSNVRYHRPQAKLLFTVRPHGVDYLRHLLDSGGFDPREVVWFDELAPLGWDAVKTLAREVLGDDHAHLTDRLASATWDCPLITVLGGRLLREKAVSPHLLERDDEFRQVLLARFQDELLGQLGNRVDRDLCQRLLKLVAATGPVRPQEERFQEAAAAFIGCDAPALVQALDALEEAGVLLRRGYTLRITPDVLADHILHEACLDRQGRPTGYAEQVFGGMGAVALSELLRNLAELDWRLRSSAGDAIDDVTVLDAIWTLIERELQSSGNVVRYWLLDLLKEVAYYQPIRMLALVEMVLRRPDPETDEIRAWWGRREIGHADVVRRLPEILRRISYSIEYLPRCSDLLWELGRDETGDPLRETEHPHRVLTDLASYLPDKPFRVNWIMLQAVERWLRAADAHDHLHSPLDVLDPLLAKQGHTAHSEQYRIVWRSFLVHREVVRELRERALELAVGCAQSDRLKIQRRAVETLLEALKEPMETRGLQVTEADAAQWVPEQHLVLDHIAHIIGRPAHPLVQIQVIEALTWQATHGLSPSIRSRAACIIDAIPRSFELLLTRLLIHSDTVWQMQRSYSDDPDLDEIATFTTSTCRDIARQLLEDYPSPQEGASLLNERLGELTAHGIDPYPVPFWDELTRQNWEYTAALCESVVEEPDSPLAGHLGALLFAIKERDADRAMGIARRALETDHLLLCRSVALCEWNWARFGSADDDILHDLLAHSDLGVTQMAFLALGSLGKSQSRAALDLALSVDIGRETVLADALCQVLDGRFGIPSDAITVDDLTRGLAKLETIPQIEGWHVLDFLALCAKRIPVETVCLLFRRIERSDLLGTDEYQPLPYIGLEEHLVGLTESSEYESLLRTIRDKWWDRKESANGMAAWWIEHLFAAVSSGFGTTSLGVLSEWISSRDPDRIAAASQFLSEAPPRFVFDQQDFAVTLLDEAYSAGDDCFEQVRHNLAASALTGSRIGTPGQPFPVDIALRDAAAAAAGQLIPGTPAHRFYVSLRKQAEGQIRDQLARDEELLQG